MLGGKSWVGREGPRVRLISSVPYCFEHGVDMDPCRIEQWQAVMIVRPQEDRQFGAAENHRLDTEVTFHSLDHAQHAITPSRVSGRN